jgi:hypothetical protein
VHCVSRGVAPATRLRDGAHVLREEEVGVRCERHLSKDKGVGDDGGVVTRHALRTPDGAAGVTLSQDVEDELLVGIREQQRLLRTRASTRRLRG